MKTNKRAFSIQLSAFSLMLTGCTISASDAGIILAVVLAFCMLMGAAYLCGWVD